MKWVRTRVARELDPDLKPHGGDRKSRGEDNQPYPGKVDYGNSTEYIRTRLKDKDPELYSQVVNKEITAAEIGSRRIGIKVIRITLIGVTALNIPRSEFAPEIPRRQNMTYILN